MKNINTTRAAFRSEGTRWKKSSHSGGNDDCVEFAIADEHILVRDSKRPDLAHTSFSAAAWRAFVSAAAADTLN
ncbi:DUF397 domain-containing protein [Streptomyces sp. NPDC021354]|uniref:DUF397 domain-containing protein n=1 Tax=Streptomyces sp. NPDC021354 TaxID=3154793 RepID=UPI0033CFAEBA